MRYAALDFETGNASPLSACSVGISVFEEDKVICEDVFLIKPPKEVGAFHWGNIKVNGIKQYMVEDAPSFLEVWHKISPYIEGSTIVCHNASFDIGVLCACLSYYGVIIPQCDYICTVKVAKRVWPNLPNHKLNTVSDALCIALNHHEAGSDARAAGLILREALQQTGKKNIAELAEYIEMQIGHISETEKMGCSIAKKKKKMVSSIG